MSDLVRSPLQADWFVTGFFTPDYRALAERLTKGLDALDVRYHLFAKDKGSTPWRFVTRWKPTIVLQAMDLYPEKTIVLLDVDATVLGDISQMVNFTGDVSVHSNARMKKRPFIRSRVKVHMSARSMVFKPTPAARKLAENWRRECDDPEGIYPKTAAETPLLIAAMRTSGLSLHAMDARWSARETSSARADAVIVHESERARTTA